MFLGLIKLSGIAFPETFVKICFLIKLLLLKQTIPTKKNTKKTSKDQTYQKAKPTC